MTRNLFTSRSSRFRIFVHSCSAPGVLAVLLAVSPAVALAQAPVVSPNGIVDGAGLGHTLVAGSVASIFGTNLANTSTNFGGIQPIPTALGGTKVTVTSGANNYQAPIYYVSSGQVNIQIPWEVAGQASASLTVTTANGTSNSESFNLAQYAPALFSAAGSGTGQGSIFNFNGSVNCPGAIANTGCTSANPANPGSIVVLTAANLGPAQFQQTDGQAPNGNLVPIANPVTVTIGGQNAPVVLAELCGGAQYCPLPNASYLIYVQVPNIASSTAAPVVVTEGAVNNSAQAITMNVASQALTTNTGVPCNFGDYQLGPINVSLQASGGTGTGYQWSVASGSLPTGLGPRNDGGPTYFPPGITTGIEGVATVPGTYTFTLQVADSANNTAQSQSCTMKILSLAITDPNQLTDGLAGSAYSYQMTSSGATGAVQWSLGGNAPSWLSINSSTGVLSGTPPQGNYGFSVNAADSTGTTSRFFSVNVYGVQFSGSADLGTFTQGSTVNLQLGGAGGTGPYTFSGCCLPQGLNLSSSGAITGTVENGDGTFRFNLDVNDSAGHGYNRQFVMNIIGNGVPPPNINAPNPVEDLTVGESRNYSLFVNGGTPPYNWTITGGTLPTGMRLLTSSIPANFNLGPDDAVITGLPTAAPPGGGTVQAYNFTVNVTDHSSPAITVSVPMTIRVSVLGLNYPNSNAFVGAPYSAYIQPIGGVTNRAPQGAVNWTIQSGSLPPGLSPPVSSGTGVGPGFGTITGTPTASGNYSVFMNINCCAGLDFVNRYIGFNVSSAGPNVITFNNLPTLPDGSVNNQYNFNLSACCTPDGLHFQAVGMLPDGLSLNGSQITGTPTTAGQYQVEFKAIDNNNSNNYGIGLFNLNITKLQVNFPPSNATIGANYGQSFGVSGGTGPYTFTMTPGSILPPGVSFSSAGVFSGTPTSDGSYHINFTITDSATPNQNVFNSGFNVNVYASSSSAPPTMNFGNNFGTWTVGEINYALSASGGNGTYTWSIINGALPTGVTIRTDPPLPSYFNGAEAGLSGVATVPGVYNFTLAVTSAGQTSYQYCTWKISALTVMDGGNLPPAFVGVPYSYTFTALNAEGPVSWMLTNGSAPPPGLTFSNGVLSGTPTQAGNFNNVSYEMTDGIDPAFRNFNLNVYAVRFNNIQGQSGFLQLNEPNLPASKTAILNNVPTSTAVSATFNAAGGSGGYTYSTSGLPCCLSLSSQGVLSGTLFGVGNFGFQVTVTDSSSNSYTQEFSIASLGDPPQLPNINLGPLSEDPVSFVGGYISWLVNVNNGGVAPFTWTVTGLPPGVSYRTYEQSELTYMTPGQVEIWGAPTAPGSYPITYTVKDGNGLTATVVSTLTISPIMVDYSNFPPNGAVGQAYSDTFRVLGGTGPYSVSQVGAQTKPLYNPFPDGLSLNAATFTISGTPIESGNFNPDLKVQDSQGHSFVMLTGFNISSGNPQINISNYFYLGNAITGNGYGNQLNSCCAPSGQYTYSVVGGSLPNGINLSASGALSGTATTPGTYNFLVKSADSTDLSNAGYKQMVLTVSTLNVTSSTSLPFGNVGTPYPPQQIETSGASGTVSFQLGNQGPLPPGITVSSSGLVSGTPSQPGQFQFNLLITDTGGDVFVGYFNLSIYPAGVTPAVGIITGANLGTVPIGVVQIALSAGGGTGSYTWSVTGGALPPGLSLRTDLPGFFPGNASAGIIGVATAASATPYSFTLKVTSGSQSATQTFSLKITGLTTMENYGFRLPDAFVGVGYQAYQLTPLNNAGTVSFKNPTQVPPGMTLSNSGVLSGTPTTGGYYNIGFTLDDTVDSVGLSISLSVNVVQVTSPAVLPNATQNQPYSFTPTASGGKTPYSFTVNGYPNGLSFNNGVLSGTVNSGPGRYFLNVTATDSNQVSYNKVIALDVIGVPPTLPWIATYGNLDDCSYGVACSRGLQVLSGGVPPFNWTITGLPNGMSYRTGSTALSSGYAATDVEFWGAPLQTGTFLVKALVTDSSSPALSSTETFQLDVSPLYPDGSYNLVNGTLGAAYSRTLRVLGGTPAGASPLYTAQVSPLQLPEGLTLHGMTVSGTPEENGGFSPYFTYTDSAGTPNTLHNTWYFNIADSGTNTINLNTTGFADEGGSTDDVIGVFAQGSTINYQLGACCASSYSFSGAGGSLPAGVSLSQSGLLNGTISGTAAPGPYTFSVQAADANNASNTGQRQYTIYVTSFNITDSTNSYNLPYGVLNTVYPNAQNQGFQLQASNNVAATFTVRPGYYMPPGLTLSPGGLISGTPTATGQYNFYIAATNNANQNDVYLANFNLSVWSTYPPLFLGTGPTLGPLLPGGSTFQLTASGGVPPYTYSVTPGSSLPQNFRVQNGGQLPTNFSLSQGTGGLIGVVDTSGTFQTSLRVTDSATPTPNVFDRPVTMILSSIAPVISNNPPAAYEGSAYTFAFAAMGGSSPYLYTISGLPAGISANGGTISGIPSTSGSFNLTVNVKDTTGTSVNFGYTLTVYPFNIATGQVLPQGVAGQSYSQQISAPNCSGCTWSIVSGGLPGGLSLNSSTGVISGTPGGLSNATFVVQAQTSGSAVAQKAFAIYVQPSTPQPLFITNNSNLYDSAYGNGYANALFAQGGTPPYTWSVSAGKLPTGMSLMSPGETLGFEFNPGFTYLIGRPLLMGPANFTLQVTDSAHNTATQAFTWTITPLYINTSLLPQNGNSTTYSGTPNPMPVPTYGVPYSQQIEVIGGTGQYTSWATPLASNPLPAGLSINQTTGVVTGTPGETGSYVTLFQVTDSGGNALEQFVTFNISAPTATTVNIGAGPILGPYQGGGAAVVNLNPSGGTAPYTFSVIAGSLPPLCALESGNQLLSTASGGYDLTCAQEGTGSYSFTLQVTDSTTPTANYGVKAMTMTFAPQTLFTNTSLANGSAGTAFSQQLLEWDNSGNITWSLAPGSALPAGMTLNGATIGGTPSIAGNYSFTLAATDSATGDVINYSFALTVSTIAITNPGIIPVHAQYLAPYSYQFTATGGGANKTWSASNLPPGLSISNTTGLVTGTAQGSGSFEVTITVSDGSSTLNRNFTMIVDYPQVLTIDPSTTSLPDARLNGSYAFTPQVSGGIGPYTWSVAQGSSLPAGLNLYTGNALPSYAAPGTTYLAGAPATAKQYTFTLVATDSASPKPNTVQATYTLNVTPMVIDSGGLPNGTINVAYSRQLNPVGGTGPYSFTYSASGPYIEVLPPGINISSSGLISGTPTSTGSYSFRVTLADSASHTYTTTYSLVITNSSGLWVTGSGGKYGITAGEGINTELGTNGNSTYTWTIPVGTIPTGLTLAMDGSVTGVFSAPGTYNFTVRATDQNNSSNFADKQLSIVVQPMQLNYSYAAPPSGTVGTQFPSPQVNGYQFSVTGGTPPYTFATLPLQPLPPGLSLSSTGLLYGTPTQGGQFNVNAMVTDHAGNIGAISDSGFNILNPGQNAPLAGFAVHTHSGTVGAPFADSSASYGYPLDGFFAGFGVPPISYAVAAGSSLPPGLQILPAANGVPAYLGGIPTTAGKYNYSLTATDSVGQAATVQMYTMVFPVGALPSLLPNGVAGSAYSATISAFGGVPPYTYGTGPTVDGFGNPSYGGMPPGLSLNAQGLISGTPTVPGTFPIAAYAQDSATPPNYVALNYAVVIDSNGTAQGIGLSPATPIELNYVLTTPAPAAVPINVTTTYTNPMPFTAMVSGIPGASLSANSGSAPATLNLNLNTAALSAGTYAGVLAVSAPTAVNGGAAIPVVLTVTALPPCVYTLVPTGDSVPAAGGAGSFAVETSSQCPWTATTADNFVTITQASASGTGTGSVQYSLSANTGGNARTGTISVNGQTYTVTQFGSSCSLALTPPSVNAAAGMSLAPVNVTTSSAACGWTASGLGATPSAGTGDQTVTFTIPANPNANPQTLTATVTLNGGAASTFTVNQAGAGCTVGLSAPGAEVAYSNPDGGPVPGQVNVTTPVGCPWTAVSGPTWIHVTTPLNGMGTGPGTLTYSVDPNSTMPRTATISVGGVPYTISQDPAPCSVTVDPSQSGSPIAFAGGGGILAVTANGSNCTWMASSPVSWLTLSTGAGSSSSVSGSGSMNITISASSNAASTMSRSASLSVAGTSVAVTQGGTQCSYVLGSSAASIPYGGGSGSVTVTAPSACLWSSSTDPSAAWLTISSSGSGGTSNVVFNAAPNATASPQVGILTIAGQQFTVTEGAGPCSYILNNTSTTLSAAGGTGGFTFSTGTSGCTTQGISFASWLVPATSSSPDGTSGNVSFTAAANPSGMTRTGTIQFGGQTYTVSETGAACAYSLNSYGLALGQGGGTNLDVYGSPSAQGCTPDVGTNQPTIVTLQALGPLTGGIFTLPFSVTPYISTVTGLRTMIITFGGQIFVIKQTSW
ncbi:MAG TPA: putative Ig domain-containing protein [Bryobacteraceae bacterium]|nr:putative Ig domain-containing protein [Bryobacteraceae bacterium]